MARAFLDLMEHHVRDAVITAPGATRAPLRKRWHWLPAGHPAPNAASVEAARLALSLARATGPGEWLVVLLSGGASAMLALPSPGITLQEKVETARALMHAGVAIDELNCVRKHLSAVKGGRLAVAAPRSFTLALSDVHAPVADDPSVIGSGPTAADPTTFRDARAIVGSIPGIPAAVRDLIERGARGLLADTPKPGDARLAEARYEVIGSRRTALIAAEQSARAIGYATVVLHEPTSGEAREAASIFVRRARGAVGGERPVCVLGAGETTVRVTGTGKGGRNQEFALAALPLMSTVGRPALLASAGTDGTDGPTDAAGAMVDSSTIHRAQRAGLDWSSSLARNDAYHFFGPLGDLITWGPTGTNVGDLQVMLIA